jgi:hypothetical protein
LNQGFDCCRQLSGGGGLDALDGRGNPTPIAESDNPLAQDPNFIKAGCHLGKYVTTTVNIEAKQVDI